MSYTDLSDWLHLHLALGQSQQLCHTLLQHFNHPATIINQTDQHLVQQGLNSKQIKRLRQNNNEIIQETIRWGKQPNQHIIHLKHEHYPEQLRQIYAPPILLYVSGNPALLNSPQIAIVGSRNPTHYGQEIGYDFSYQLAKQGLTVTSGMAIGIDTQCHHGALAATGRTIAVLGSGLNSIYPRSNMTLATTIKNRGALISEYPLGCPPKAHHFPQRNRIISGLSLGLVVVEASIRSGSLISARLALEQNREVFAIPGSIHNPLSKGCLRLLQQGAKPIEKIKDILDELILSNIESDFILDTQGQKQYRKHSDPNMNKILECVDDAGTCAEKITRRSGFHAKTVTSMLLKLELHGYIGSSPNGYRRIK